MNRTSPGTDLTRYSVEMRLRRRKVLAMVTTLGLSILSHGCSWSWPGGSAGDEPVVFEGEAKYDHISSLGEGVVHATVIVIGRITDQREMINGSRDVDRSRPSASNFAVGQFYHLSVERYLKGTGPQTLEVYQWEGSARYPNRNKAKGPITPQEVGPTVIARARAATRIPPLRSGERYLLFLRPSEIYGKPYYGNGAHPWRFTLPEGGQSFAEVPGGALSTSTFPARPSAELVTEVERLIALGPAAAHTPTLPPPTPTRPAATLPPTPTTAPSPRPPVFTPTPRPGPVSKEPPTPTPTPAPRQP